MINTLSRVHVSHPAMPLVADRQPCRESVQHENSTDEEVLVETTTVPISRKERRKRRKNDLVGQIPTPPASDAESTFPPNNPPKTKHKLTLPRPTTTTTTSSTAGTTIPPTMSTARNAGRKIYPLLICSLGNPGSTYANTLHSAGHTVTSHIADVKNYRPFTKGFGGLVSRPGNVGYSFGILQGFKKTKLDGPPEEDDWTFWQSTTLMNVSGPAVKRAWTEFSRGIKSEGSEPRLVVVHDELESPLGKVSVKDGSGSPRGHNGLKSVQASMGSTKWWRVGVGIGRPESRDANVVSRYVLKEMDAREQIAVEKSCSAVVAVLREIGEGKR